MAWFLRRFTLREDEKSNEKSNEKTSRGGEEGRRFPF